MERKKTSLHSHHVELKAKMGAFAGFEMPIQYTSVKEEVLAVRNNCGVFDVGHMGEFFITGKDAIKFVDYLITNDFAAAGNEKAVYSPLCREDGTVIDDLIAYKLAPEKVLICVNAANIQKDWDWISSKANGFNIELVNKSGDYSLIAVQGPNTESIFTKLSLIPEAEFPYYSAKEHKFKEENIIIARTGYTGEDGFEVFCSHACASLLWNELISLGVHPRGLASRDVLRLEVCYPLYGHEIHDGVTPFDAGLKWTVKLHKNDFIGKNALNEYVPKYRLVKLSLEKGIPREDYPILDAKDNAIGKVTSGTMSVVLGQGICLGLIERDKFPSDKRFKVNIRNNNYEAEYHSKAFVNGGHK